MDERIREAEEYLNKLVRKMLDADEEDDIPAWKRAHSRLTGAKKALRIVGYNVRYDEDTERYEVTK